MQYFYNFDTEGRNRLFKQAQVKSQAVEFPGLILITHFDSYMYTEFSINN